MNIYDIQGTSLQMCALDFCSFSSHPNESEPLVLRYQAPTLIGCLVVKERALHRVAFASHLLLCQQQRNEIMKAFFQAVKSIYFTPI